MKALLPYFFITVRRNNLENISLIDIEIIGFLLTHGLPTTSIVFRIVRICRSLFKSSYLKNKKHFRGFLFHLWNLHQISNIFKKKTIVIGNVIPKLATVQGLVRPLTIQRSLKTSFDSQHVKRFQTLAKSSWEHLYHIFSSLWGEIIWKIYPWLRFEIIGFLLTHGLPISRLQVSCSGLWEFVVPYLNPVILKTKNIFAVFYSIYGISIKFRIFSKKRRSS